MFSAGHALALLFPARRCIIALHLESPGQLVFPILVPGRGACQEIFVLIVVPSCRQRCCVLDGGSICILLRNPEPAGRLFVPNLAPGRGAHQELFVLIVVLPPPQATLLRP